MTGGALLIASVLFDVVTQSTALLIGGMNLVGTVSFSGALLVFAFGVRGSGSVTARRPLGSAALTLLAVWVLLVPALDRVIFSADSSFQAMQQFGYVDSLVRFVAALVAVSQIGRAGVVPRPWNWAPAWVLAAVVAPWLLVQLAGVGAAGESPSIVMVILTD